MITLTRSGRETLAESIKLRDVHVAWGPGDGSWTTPPAEDVLATAVTGEIARRTASEVSFVDPDEDGDIVLSSGNYTRSVTPTNYLFVEAAFAFDEAPTSTIRQFGVFVGTTIVGGLPAGQEYFTPAQVATPGRMLALENREPIVRTSTSTVTYRAVFKF